MRHPLIRQGEGPHAAHTRLQHEQAELRRTLDRIHNLAAPLDTRTLTRATAAGDERKLRGIPVQAPGVAGHIPGTRP